MSLKLINVEESQTFWNRRKLGISSISILKYYYYLFIKIQFLWKANVPSYVSGKWVINLDWKIQYQVFAGPLLLTTHCLFIYYCDPTVITHFLHFWENNFNNIPVNLTTQHAQQTIVALKFLEDKGNGGTMALNDSAQRHDQTAFGWASSSILYST